MSDEQIARIADAVAAKLNGQLSGLRKDVAALKTDVGEIKTRLGTVETRLGTVEEAVSETARKVDDLHDWFGLLEGRVTALENNR